MLYFSYGSNMSSRRLRHRVPAANFVTTATLYGHDLRFHKRSLDGSAKCDAYKTGDDTDSIIGVVFDLTESEKPILDTYEGLGHGYDKKIIEVETDSGHIIEAMTYYALIIDPALKPYHWYKQHVLRGAMEHELPEEYTKHILGIDSLEDPDTSRHEREMAIYQDVDIQVI